MKNGFKIVDADLHIVESPELWQKRLPEPYRSMTKMVMPVGAQESSNVQYQLGNLKWDQSNPFVVAQSRRRLSGVTAESLDRNRMEFRRNPTPALLQEAMDAEGMDIAAIVPTRTFAMTTVDGIDPEYALALCRTFNDWVAEFCAANRERFRFWGWLPRQSAELAALEARRCVKELGADGVAMTSGAVNGKLLSDPDFEPLWNEVTALDVPLGLHLWGASRTLKDDLLHRYLDKPHGQGPFVALNGVFHAMTSIAELIYSGVLERHPALRPVVMEAGNTWLLFLLDRLDEKWELYEPEFREQYGVTLSMSPSAYFKRQCFVTCEGEERALKYLVAEGLTDNILFSTDYPHHDAAWPHGVDHLLDQQFSQEAKRKILWDNTIRAFGWKAPAQIVT